jgi:hypothetical protein
MTRILNLFPAPAATARARIPTAGAVGVPAGRFARTQKALDE